MLLTTNTRQFDRRLFRGLARRAREGSARTLRARDRSARRRRREAAAAASMSTTNAGENPQEQTGELVADARPISSIHMQNQQERRQSQSNPRRLIPNSIRSSLSASNRSWIKHHSTESGDVLINATLVEEEEPLEYAVAEEMNFWQRNASFLLPCLSFTLVVILAATITPIVLLERQENRMLSQMPSEAPSLAPSQDPRPTLVIVQERDTLKCGVDVNDTASVPFRRELCRAIAAVVLGDPDSFTLINPFDPLYYDGKGRSKFFALQNAAVDVQISGETHTVEREVVYNVSFSTPYYYDGASYNGDPHYVTCAYNQTRYGECDQLFICAIGKTVVEYIQSHFAPDFWTTGLSLDDNFESYRNFTANETCFRPDTGENMTCCNVIAAERHAASIRFDNMSDDVRGSVIGKQTFTNEPLAFVTRNDESVWSDIVNWVMRALIYGERQGLVQDDSMCEKEVIATDPSELNYLNAVYCVGNYAEIFARGFDSSSDRNLINHVNNGTGELTCFHHTFLQLQHTNEILCQRNDVRYTVWNTEPFCTTY